MVSHSKVIQYQRRVYVVKTREGKFQGPITSLDRFWWKYSAHYGRDSARRANNTLLTVLLTKQYPK